MDARVKPAHDESIPATVGIIGAAREYHSIALAAEIDTMARSRIDSIFIHSGADRLHSGCVTLFQTAERGRHSGPGDATKSIEPVGKRASAILREIALKR